jgi:hypothetical protein
MAAEFRLAVETAGRQTPEKMVLDRMNLLAGLGNAKPADAAGPAEPDSQRESVRGYKMENVETSEEETSLSSSGVEWFAALFVLAVLGLFFIGLRRGTR